MSLPKVNDTTIYVSFLFRVALFPLCVLIALFVSSLVFPPSLGQDFVIGFTVWDSMMVGGEWNTLYTPSPKDISESVGAFLTWWSPGQYIIPGIINLIGTSLATSLSIVAFICGLVGLLGYALLFRQFGFSDLEIGISLFVISTCWYFTYPYRIYIGAEILQFAWIPWVLMFSRKLEGLNWLELGVLLTLFLVGVFLKLSFFVVAIAICLTLCLTKKTTIDRTLVKYVVRLSALLIVLYGTVYLTFLSKGSTPSGVMCGGMPFADAIAHAMFNVLSSVFALNSVLHNVLGTYAIDIESFVLILGIVSFFIFFLVYREQHEPYKTWVLGFFVTFTTVYTIFYVLGSCVSTEDRHFFVVGALFLPGIIRFALIKKSLFRKSVISTFLIGSTFYGLLAYALTVYRSELGQTVSSRGYSYVGIPSNLVTRINAIDYQGVDVDSLFIFDYVPLLLEPRHSRVSKIDWRSPKCYQGKIDLLVVISNDSFITEDSILQKFCDYIPEDILVERVDDWRIYLARL